MNCTFCGAKLDLVGKVSRRDTCPKCGRDLRCCKHCQHYDPRAYNECREVAAERIRDKERANFCDYFVFRGTKVNGGRRGGYMQARGDAMDALEALFKKK